MTPESRRGSDPRPGRGLGRQAGRPNGEADPAGPGGPGGLGAGGQRPGGRRRRLPSAELWAGWEEGRACASCEAWTCWGLGLGALRNLHTDAAAGGVPSRPDRTGGCARPRSLWRGPRPAHRWGLPPHPAAPALSQVLTAGGAACPSQHPQRQALLGTGALWGMAGGLVGPMPWRGGGGWGSGWWGSQALGKEAEVTGTLLLLAAALGAAPQGGPAAGGPPPPRPVWKPVPRSAAAVRVSAMTSNFSSPSQLGESYITRRRSPGKPCSVSRTVPR